MEEVSLGCLGWMPDDFEKYTASDMVRAVRGYDQGQKHEWERVRVTAYYGLIPHLDKKKHGELKLMDIKLPIDIPKIIKKEDMATVNRLTRSQVKEQWKKAGIDISESALDRMNLDRI